MAKRSMFVGMDVHKESIDISLAEEGRDGEVRHYGVIAGDLEAAGEGRARAARAGPTIALCTRPARVGLASTAISTAQGEDCVVVNPSSMPKRSGDRIKTDRRDGDALARLHRAGELTAIYIPTADDEALRDLVRAREDARRPEHPGQASVEGVPAAPGAPLSGTRRVDAPVSPLARRSQFPARPQHIALQEYRDTIDETERRVERLTDQLRQLTPAWRWAPVVEALQALRGVSFVTAVGLVAEVGDIRRFTHPRRADGVLGLVPSEYSSGPVSDAAGSRKAGNPHARRLLAEAAWAYQGVPRIGRQMLYRQEALPKAVLRHRVEGAAAPDVTVSQAWWRAARRNPRSRPRSRAS